ncbi:hypothetical protein D018_0451B, partial [Vibrio parahaemolyticus VP2007-007]
TMPDLN